MVEVLEDRIVPATLTVTSLADDGSAGTLRYEIGQAQAGDTINFQSGLSGTITLSSSNGPLVIAENLTITGPTASAIAISGNDQVQDLRVTGGTVTIGNLTFTGGNSTKSGGGIYVGASGKLTLVGCTVSGNTTTQGGGGIYVTGTKGGITVINSTIAENQAGSTGGGGVEINDGAATFTNCTIADNTTSGYGGGVLQAGNIVVMYASNTIFAANSEKQYGDVFQSSTETEGGLGDNLVGNADGDIDFDYKSEGNIYGTTANPLNPELGPLQNNGGPTQTMALLTGSPAIDKGSTTYAVDQNNNPLQYDQRGPGFPRTVNNTVDIGAYEHSPYPPITISPTSVPAGVVGTAYTQTTLSASGGTGTGFTFAVTSGSTDGLTLSSAGVLSGTPAAAGTFSFTVTATDSGSNTGTQNYSLVINPGVALSPATLPTGTVGDSYNQTLAASGGVGGPYTYSYTGTLPNGISFNTATGAFSGTPTQAGSFNNIVVTAKDGSGDTGTQSYTLTIVSITVSPTTLPVANVGNAYSPQTLTAQNGIGPYTYSVTSGSLPNGLSLSSGGSLSGTPTATGTFSFTVTAKDSEGATGTQNYSFTVESAIALSPSSPLPLAVAGTAYISPTFSASGGSGTGFTFAITSGTLPTGLSLSGNQITGTPAAVGTPTTTMFTVTATDSLGGKGSQSYQLTVDPKLTISPASLPVALDNNSYSVNLVPGGGSGTGYSFQQTGLPTGLTLSSAGLLSGTPPTVNQPTLYSVTVTLTDSLGGSYQQKYTLTVEPPLTLAPATLPYAAENGLYSFTFSASGGSGTGYQYSETGALPAGISLKGNQLTGAATVDAGTYNFTITVIDNVGGTTSQNYSITVEGPIVFNPATLPVGTVNNPYNQGIPISVSSSAGGPYTLTVSGNVPGLGFDTSSDELVGTPTQAGSFQFTVSAVDGQGGTGSRSFTVVIDSALAIGPTNLPSGTVNNAYRQVLTASGGSGAGYTFTGSGLPSWLTLSSAGVLSGTPTSQIGSPFTFTITVTDSTGGTGSRAYSLSLDPAITFGPSALPSTAQGDAYYVALSATGGSGTGYSYDVTAGALPSGIGFSGNVLTGQDVTALPGTYSFTITVTDSRGASSNQNYSIVVGPPVTISPGSLSAGTLGNVYSQTLTVSGGSGTGYIFSALSPLPAGLTLNANTGVLSGTPTQFGSFSFTVAATDSQGGTGTQAFSLNIRFSLGNSPNARFVDAIYQDLLHRAPDPGAETWLNLLNHGVAPSTVVLDVESSAEYLTDLVASIYQKYLGRALDSGASSWISQLEAGVSVESVTASILASSEYFYDRGNSNTGFLNGLYNDVLGRSADAGGLKGWLAFLNGGGSRYQAALAFLTSTEYETDLVAGYGWTASGNPGVGGYYLTYLGRQGDPQGVAGWVQVLQSGLSDQAVLAAIAGSPEGYNHLT